MADNIAEANESDSGFTYLLAILFSFLPFVLKKINWNKLVEGITMKRSAGKEVIRL